MKIVRAKRLAANVLYYVVIALAVPALVVASLGVWLAVSADTRERLIRMGLIK